MNKPPQRPISSLASLTGWAPSEHRSHHKVFTALWAAPGRQSDCAHHGRIGEGRSVVRALYLLFCERKLDDSARAWHGARLIRVKRGPTFRNGVWLLSITFELWLLFKCAIRSRRTLAYCGL